MKFQVVRSNSRRNFPGEVLNTDEAVDFIIEYKELGDLDDADLETIRLDLTKCAKAKKGYDLDDFGGHLMPVAARDKPPG